MKKKARKKSKKLQKLVSSLLIIISIILIISLISFNILPFIYQAIVIFIIVVIDLFLVLLMLKSRKKKTGTFISLILIIIMSFLSFYIFKTAGLLKKLNLDYKTYNYSVIVLKDSEYKKINDIDSKELGFYETETEECEKSLTKLSKKVTTENSGYEDIQELASDLLEKKVDAILLENSYLDILNENNNSTTEETFDSKTTIIYKFSITIKTNDISKDIDVTKKPFNIYVSGIDTYGEISSISRSDVNMVVTVNPSTRQILLTSIPRDYYVPLHGKTGYNDKLTHAGLYGTDMSLKTIEDLLDIEINYYVKVNFSSVIDIVNAIDGVSVYSDYAFTSIDGYKYQEGYNEVNGEQALSFARERKAFATGDRQRIKDQQALLEAIFRKCTSTAIISKYNNLLNSIKGSFVTNMPTDRLTSLIKMQISKMYKWTITANSLDGSDASNYTYSYASQKLYVMEPIEESVQYATELITSVLEGEKLDPTYDGNASDVHQVVRNSASSTTTNNSKTEETTNQTTTTIDEGLKVSLGRTSVTIKEGEDFIYYGYTATYNKKNVTQSTTATFSINGHTYTDYSELINYITNNLSSGEYNIVYKIKYQNESETLNQTVIIKENTSIKENQENSEISDTENSTNDNKNEETTNDTSSNEE